MREFSTNDLLVLLEATSVILKEIQNRGSVSFIDPEEFDLWAKRKKQFTEARNSLLEELGRRVLEASNLYVEVY